MKAPLNTASAPIWVKSLSNDAYFAEEQACLSQVWNFLGLERDIPNDNDWFRARLGNRSIFVQRFKDGLRAFENICPHRFNALRTEDKGNGHVVCGFHHWRFDSSGDVVGIPKCKEMYNKTPKEIGASLTSVDIAVCGGFIFGRVGAGPSLEEWLDVGYDILSYVTTGLKLGGQLDLQVNAHWKSMMHISLDDYHGVAVHPTTFGKNGYLPASGFDYFRFGAHSSMMLTGNQVSLDDVVQACKDQTFLLKKGNYMIFQFFPTFLVVLIQPTRLYGDDYRYLLIQHFSPQSRKDTHFHTRFFLMPFSRPAGFVRRLVRKLTIPFVNVFFKYYMARINKEDNQVCENIQKVAHQIHGDMQLSAMEQRVGWFEEVYAQYVTAKINQKNRKT